MGVIGLDVGKEEEDGEQDLELVVEEDHVEDWSESNIWSSL